MIKKTLPYLISLILLIQLVYAAAEVCIVVDYGDQGIDPESECIEIDEGKSGYELLNEVGWSTKWKDESYLCNVNDIGNDPSNCFGDPGSSGWMYSLTMGGDWFPPLVTLNGTGGCWNRDKDSTVGHYCTRDEDVLGLAFGGWGAIPKMFTMNISKIYVDDDRLTDSKVNRGKIQDVFPESKVEFKIELENFYDSSTEIAIKDISIEATIEEIDDGDDIDEDIGEFDLEADKEKTETLEFTIPLEVEAKDRLLKIEIKAEDDAGIKYEEEFTYDLEVEKEDHKLRITKAELNKESYKCEENAILYLSILNIGAKNENVNLAITNQELDINIKESFELSNDAFEPSSRYEERYNIWLNDNLDKTTYPITIISSYGSEKETETINLIISECEGTTTKKEETKETTKVQTEQETGKDETKSKTIKQTITSVKTNSNTPVILAGILTALIVITIALGAVFYIKRK